MPCYRHGSPDSKDVDVYYAFPSMPSVKECSLFVAGTAEDRNVIVINKGVITGSYKGISEVFQG